MTSRTGRLAAAPIALCAALGVAAGFSAVFGRTGSVPLAACAGAIAVVFLAVGWAMVGLGRVPARRGRSAG